jgi:hypothetical protein
MNHDDLLSEWCAHVRDFIDRQMACFDVRLAHAEAARPETLPAETRFNELALGLFELQYQRNPVVKRLAERRGVSPASVTHWREIPALPAAAFKQLEVTTLPPGERTRVFHSSGTTAQQPGRHFHSAQSLALYEASLLPWFRAHLLGGSAPCDDPDRLDLLCLTPSPALTPHSSLVHMLDTLRRKLPWHEARYAGTLDASSAWSLDTEDLTRALRRLEKSGQPVTVLGTAFNFVHLLDHLETTRLRLQLPEGSRVMETGGYKGRSRTVPKPELHAWISEYLGVPSHRIVCEYGMSELSSQAYDHTIDPGHDAGRAARRAFRFPPWARAQIISPETGREASEGETGLVRVFDLANPASTVGLQTEDLGVRRGKGFELLGRTGTAEPRGCSLMSLGTGTPNPARSLRQPWSLRQNEAA